MKRRRDYPMGTVSHATMRPEDLIPSFLSELEYHAKAHGRKDHLTLCREIQERIDGHTTDDGDAYDYYNSDDATYDLDELFSALDEYAGPYFYFGAHPGDGSAYGFWLCEEIQHDFDGLKVADLSEVPRDYSGEILHINDHGNMSLYVKARTQKPREVWAVV